MNINAQPLRTLMVLSVSIATSLFFSCSVNRAHAASLTWNGAGGDNNWSTPANWGGTAPTSGDSVFFDGSIRTTTTNNLLAGTLFNGIGFNNTAGAFTLRGNGLTLGGDIVDNTALVPQTISLSLSLNATRNVNVAADGSLTIGGVISGAGFGLTKTGAGQLTLTAANTFSGPVTINAGNVSVSSDSNLGVLGRIGIDGGALRTTASFTLAAGRGIALGPEGATGTGTITVNSGTTLTYGGIIANNGSGTGGLTKNAFGGLTLSGANAYTGPTSNRVGTVTLDFTQASSPPNDILSASSPLTLGGENAGFGATNFAALIMNGKASATSSQTFNGTHLTFGGSVIRANSGSGWRGQPGFGLAGPRSRRCVGNGSADSHRRQRQHHHHSREY